MAGPEPGALRLASLRAGSLLQVPYRPFFLCGALEALTAVGLWFWWVQGLRAGSPPSLSWTLPPARAHAVVMLWGVVTLYVFGFLLTAFPRWVQAPEPSRRAVLAWLGALLAGQALFVAGALGRPVLVTAGGTLWVASLLSLAAWLGRALRTSPTGERLQPASILLALATGAAGLALVTAGPRTGSDRLYLSGLQAGVYGYLALLILAVGHRIIPFFTARARGRDSGAHRRGTLPAVTVLILLHLGLACLARGELAARATAGTDAVLLLVLAREVSAWDPGPALRNPMIWILYLAQAWVMASLALSALAPLRLAHPGAVDLPAVHALVIGGAGTLITGVSTRVTLGHGGRPVRADGWIVLIFALVELAAVARVLLLLSGPWLPAGPLLAHWAAIPWCLAFALWLARLGPLLFEET